MEVFKLMNLLRQGFWCVSSGYFAFFLQYNFSFIVFLIYKMNGNTAFLFLVLNNRFMHMLAVHAFAAKLWQKGRVNIHDFFRKSFHHFFRYFQKKTGENN